jgi:hypothetical protein
MTMEANKAAMHAFLEFIKSASEKFPTQLISVKEQMAELRGKVLYYWCLVSLSRLEKNTWSKLIAKSKDEEGWQGTEDYQTALS